MEFHPPLQAGTLVQRYKRFLADIITQDGRTITIHLPIPVAMTGCATPGDTVWYSESANAKRKYPHSWELAQTQAGHLICVNTMQANGWWQKPLHRTGSRNLRVSDAGTGSKIRQ